MSDGCSPSNEKRERQELSYNRVESYKPDNVTARLLFSEPASPGNILNREATLRADVERLVSIIEGNGKHSP
ncbi:hypothetical protein MKX08_003873 [Trichoderma sp. CBMAI-0020]|nr:hypothetical protein MKX08_003873 [Trichoderma sp. CBMAI-0020]